jgi:hypothetical protein
VLRSDPERDALGECANYVDWLSKGATKQRRQAKALSIVVAGGAAVIPLLLLLSTQYQDFFLGKFLPAMAAAATALAGVALQVLKPHERWQLLQRERRLLERKLAPYNSDANKDLLLLTHVAQSGRTVAEAWSALIPPSTEAAKLLGSGHK